VVVAEEEVAGEEEAVEGGSAQGLLHTQDPQVHQGLVQDHGSPDRHQDHLLHPRQLVHGHQAEVPEAIITTNLTTALLIGSESLITTQPTTGPIFGHISSRLTLELNSLLQQNKS